MNSGPVPLPTDPALPEAEADADAERLSAWLDGELDERASDPLVAGLLRRPELQQRFAGWCLVGDALRSREVLAEHSPALCARINAALQSEPALLAPAALAPGLRAHPVKRHLASGFAVAAAAAMLVFVAVPQLRNGGVADTTTVASRATAPSTLVAGGVEQTALAAPAGSAHRDPRLDPYIQAHREFMGSGVMPAAAVYLRSGTEGER